MNPTLFGHRGAAAEQPENTMPSFRRALEVGATAIETDVHLTADGHFVLAHDADGRRMANVLGAIRDSRLAEVRGWDAGWGFVDDAGGRIFAGRGYRVPTLEEALVELDGVHFNIDVKPSDPEVVPALLALLRRLRAQDRVRLASFSAKVMGRIRALGYEGETALTTGEVLRAVARLPMERCGNAAQVPLRVGPLALDTAAVIERFHRRGLRVDFWTVNDPETARRLLALGADGIVTDDPARLAPLFAAAPREMAA
jgi:glycerophosphoryl diester phosphodiesterase